MTVTRMRGTYLNSYLARNVDFTPRFGAGGNRFIFGDNLEALLFQEKPVFSCEPRQVGMVRKMKRPHRILLDEIGLKP